jgi:Na+:H+ antiporter, NhaA family
MHQPNETGDRPSQLDPLELHGLPAAPIRRLMLPFSRFFEIEAASGIVLLLCTVAALLIANSEYGEAFAHFWHHHIGFVIDGRNFGYLSVHHWITDGLMTIFFFVMGLEIKRELVAGELRDPKKAALPVLGAVGGMIAPAVIFLALQWGQEAQGGWGIPVATDIAFVVALIALFGTRAPLGLKVFVLSLAIADDIGAVVVIALFYTSEISFAALGLAAIGFGVVFALNRLGVRRVPVYVLVGVGIWLCFLYSGNPSMPGSGVHPTVAGVLLGLLTPASAWIGDRAFFDIIAEVGNRLRSGKHISKKKRHESLGMIAMAAHETASPLERLEIILHPWVAFVIIPLFALANVGVKIDASAVGSPVVYAVALGLFLGKPAGIVLACWVAVKVGVAKLPTGVNWAAMTGAGCLCGIGFTMSLLIANLSLHGLPPSVLEGAKIGVLSGSLLSAIVGCGLLLKFLPRSSEAHEIAEVEAIEEEFDAHANAISDAQAQAGERTSRKVGAI